MASRTIAINLTGTNASAVKAIDGVGAAATKVGAQTDKALGPAATSKIGAGFSKLGATAGQFGVPFAGALGVVGGKLEQAESKTKGFGKTLSTIGGAEAAAAGAGLLFVGASAIHAALEGEAAQARLQTAVKNNGSAYKDYGGAVDEASAKLAKYGFENDDVESSIAKLIPATRNVSKAIELQGLAADLARGRNIDLGAATDILVKVEAGRYTALTRAGIATAAQIKGFKSTGDAIDLLAQKYGGAAEKNAETFSGKIQALQATAHNLEEELGQALIPQLEKLASGALSTVSGFQSANAATDGWLGKIGVAAVSVPVAVFAIDKLVTGAKAIGGTFATAGSAIGKLTGITKATTVAEEEQGAAFAGSAGAASAKVSALAALGVANERLAATDAALAEAEGALAAAQYDTLASDAEIVGATNAVGAARSRQAIAAANAAQAEEALAATSATSGEAVGASFAAALGPITLVAAGIGGAALALNHFFGGNNDTGKIKDLAVSLTEVGKGAQDAQAGLSKIVGSGASAALAQYSTLVLENASAQDKAKAKSEALAAAVLDSGGNFIKANGQIDTATKALDDYAKKNGLAATQTAILGAAQKRYADDLASGRASERALADDKQAVIDASKKQAATQNAVNDATKTGVDAATANADATKNSADAASAAADAEKKHADALQLVDDKLKQLNDDTIGAANSDIASQKAVLAVGDAAQTVADKLVALSKAKKDGGQASRDFKGALADENSAIVNVASTAETAAKSHYDLTHSLDANATSSQKAAFAIGEENAKHAAGVQALQALEFQYPALKGAIDTYISSLKLVPPEVKTKVSIDNPNPVVHVEVDVPSVQVQVLSDGAAGRTVRTIATGGSRFVFAKGGQVQPNKEILVGEKGPELFLAPGAAAATVIGAQGPELWTPPTSGDIIPNDKVKSFAARGAGSHATVRGYAAGTVAPFGSFGTFNNDPVTVTFTSGSSSGGLSGLLGAIPSTGDAVSTFEQRIADAERVAKIRKKQAEQAAKDYTTATTKLGEARKKSIDAQKKFRSDSLAASHVGADQGVVDDLDRQLKFLQKAHAPTDNIQKLISAARKQLSKDTSAANRLAPDLIAVDKAEQAHRKANEAFVLARGAKSNTLNVEKQAERTARAASDPAQFTAAVLQDQAAVKLFESELKTLLRSGDTRLARVLADAGPATAGSLAAGFVKDLRKAAQAERSLGSFDAQTKDYSDFASANFKASGGNVRANKPVVVGEHGPEVFVPDGAGKIIPNGQSFSPVSSGQSFNPTRGNQKIELVLTVPIHVDGVLQGTKVVNVLLDHQRLNGPLPIRVKATA